MSYLVSTLAGLIVLALLAWAARATGPRRQTTWVCRSCGRGFSDQQEARTHVATAHGTPP
jgi:hypothetical protein